MVAAWWGFRSTYRKNYCVCISLYSNQERFCNFCFSCFFFVCIKLSYHLVWNKNNTTGTTSGAGTACHSLTCSPLLIWHGVGDLKFICFSVGHYSVCPSIYASDYPFSIFKLFLENITITNRLFLSLLLFLFTLLFSATFKKFSLFTQAFLYPIPEIVKTLLNDESATVPQTSIPDKCTISPSPVIQV